MLAAVRSGCGWAKAAVLLAAIVTGPGEAADWPTLRHDQRRSGATPERLEVAALQPAWVHRPVAAPRPAWPGPARWDAYVKRPQIASMRNYDESFHVVAADGLVFFGSSADDSLHCLDLATGQEQWAHATGGPVRLPPTVHEGRLFFGGDDGQLWCVKAADGSMLWHRPAAVGRLILHDGRLVSAAPLRAGVIVEEDRVWWTAGMLPWDDSFVGCAATSDGTTTGPGTFVRGISHATPEGCMLRGVDHILVTQGRASPLMLDRGSGTSRGVVPGVHGGIFALVADDGRELVGPGPREGFFSETDAGHSAAVARKYGAVAMAAADGMLYVLERATLGCFRIADDAWVWRRPCPSSQAVIVAGDHVIVGGDDRVDAFDRVDGAAAWSGSVTGRAQGLAVADETLLVSTDEGSIHAFRATGATAQAGAAAQAEEPPPAPPPVTGPVPAARVPDWITCGPVLRFTAPDAAVVTWRTSTPMPTTVVWGQSGDERRIHREDPVTDHEARLDGLRRRRVIPWSIVASDTAAGPFECDTFLNPVAAVPAVEAPTRDPPAAIRADAARVGTCLLAGADELPLAVAIAGGTRLHVTILDDDEARVAAARAALLARGLLGTRIAVVQIDDVAAPPVADRIAAVAVVGARARRMLGAEGVGRWLATVRPGGCLFLPGCGDDERPELTGAATAAVSGEGLLVRPAPPGGIGTWTHQYGGPDNATFAGETLAGARSCREFTVQWLGRPGPRFQSDRGNRKPAPLFSNGRLFAQGLDRFMALDAYSGAILWHLEVPDSRRFNIRHDAANWCCDDQRLFVAVRGGCWEIDAERGTVGRVHAAGTDGGDTWGYVGRWGDRLVGTAVPSRAAYQEFWGGEFWYTAAEGPLAANVCSRSLFAIDVASGREVWRRAGTVVDTSIAMADGRVVFVELPTAAGGRIGDPAIWDDARLVAVAAADGRVLWERPLDLGRAATMFSLACGGGRVVAVASRRGEYAVGTWNAGDGSRVWQTTFPWEAVGKGGDSARPAIVNGVLYVSPKSFDLATGRELPAIVRRGACGSYAASSHAFLTRLGSLGLWDPVDQRATTWERLRPDCWLSAIPAGGMILAPEGGGGCSCGGWLETSIAFAPVRVADRPEVP